VHVIARASAAVRAQDRAYVWSDGRVHVDAYDRATVVAAGRSHVRAAGESRVFAGQRALITILDGAEALCGDEVTVHATGHARVQALGHARVFADGEAVVRAAIAASVRARGTVQVWAHRDVRVLVEGSGVAVHRERAGVAATHGLPLLRPADHGFWDTRPSPRVELVQAELGRPGF
jgi:hypothetical protein